ncbi:hypothetical protein CLU79DRAFT_751561 [Phycomyces nitens]|nr:hypothetical protein CLU79DRAFT_751561 [Phycomyces nitens]
MKQRKNLKLINERNQYRLINGTKNNRTTLGLPTFVSNTIGHSISKSTIQITTHRIVMHFCLAV